MAATNARGEAEWICPGKLVEVTITVASQALGHILRAFFVVVVFVSTSLTFQASLMRYILIIVSK